LEFRIFAYNKSYTGATTANTGYTGEIDNYKVQQRQTLANDIHYRACCLQYYYVIAPACREYYFRIVQARKEKKKYSQA